MKLASALRTAVMTAIAPPLTSVAPMVVDMSARLPPSHHIPHPLTYVPLPTTTLPECVLKNVTPRHVTQATSAALMGVVDPACPYVTLYRPIRRSLGPIVHSVRMMGCSPQCSVMHPLATVGVWTH